MIAWEEEKVGTQEVGDRLKMNMRFAESSSTDNKGLLNEGTFLKTSRRNLTDGTGVFGSCLVD